MNPENEQDPLSELLSGFEFPPSNPGHREAVFSQTCGVLRRRRLLRRMTRIAAFVACWIFGVFSVLAWQAVQRHQQIAELPADRAIETKSSLPAEKDPAPSDTMISPPETDRSESDSISRSESSGPLTTFEKMRRAGDRQLNELGNLRGAIGCYRRALDFASDNDLQIVPERDSWLLIPLKEARLESRKHVHKRS